MNVRLAFLRLLTALVFVALASTSFGGATAMAGGDAAMAMAAEAEAMPCCPPEQPITLICDKSACPSMAACAQQCAPASASVHAFDSDRFDRETAGRRAESDRLASLRYEPPPRPPRA